MKTNIPKAILIFLLGHCAVLHQHHIGDMDNTLIPKKEKIVILKSQFGIATGDAGILAGGANNAGAMSNDNYNAFEIARTIFELSNMGPRTGERVFSDTYMDKIMDEIYNKCPSGNIINLTSTRETAIYPVIRGEIIKITGDCVENKK